jgi:hypothetical protein
VRMCSSAQGRRIAELLYEREGFVSNGQGRARKLAWLSEWVGRPVDTSKALTYREAALISELDPPAEPPQ